MADNTQQPGILNMLLTGGMPQQAQSQVGNILQGLLQYAQPTPNVQSANASLGQGTINVLNNAAQFTGNPALAAGNYDASQNTGINQQQLAQTLQRLGQSGAGISNLPQQGLGNVQTINQNQLPPQAQKAAQKVLQQHYDNHAQQALNQPGGIQALSAVANGQNNQQQNQPQQPQTSSQGQPQQSNQQQMPTGGILSRLLGMDLNPKGTAQRLQNMASLQDINAGQPSKIALPSAQASQIRAQAEMQNLQNQGNEPIQPKDYMSAYSGMYQKALDSYGKVSDSAKDMANTSQELFSKTADATRNAAQKMIGMPSRESQATFQSAVAAQKAALDATSDFHQFLFKNNPSQVMNQISQKVSGATGGNIKVGDKFNGETVMNLKRIK